MRIITKNQNSSSPSQDSKQVDPEYEAVFTTTTQKHTHNALLEQPLNSNHAPATTERVSMEVSFPDFRRDALGLNPNRNLLI